MALRCFLIIACLAAFSHTAEAGNSKRKDFRESYERYFERPLHDERRSEIRAEAQDERINDYSKDGSSYDPYSLYDWAESRESRSAESRYERIQRK